MPSFQKSDVCSSDRYLLDHPRAQRGQKSLRFLSDLAYKQHWRTDLTKYDKIKYNIIKVYKIFIKIKYHKIINKIIKCISDVLDQLVLFTLQLSCQNLEMLFLFLTEMSLSIPVAYSKLWNYTYLPTLCIAII